MSLVGSFISLFTGKLQEKEESRQKAVRQARGIDADLRDVLARVELLDPVWTTQQFRASNSEPYDSYPELESGKIQEYRGGNEYRGDYREWVLQNTGPWCILMTFVQNTEDGKLETHVFSSPRVAFVCVELQGARIKALAYCENDGDGPSTTYTLKPPPKHEHKTSPVAVQHLREWVRRRALPELEAAKVQRDAASQQYEARCEAMRKKYLS
jgi:hypothetical protein